LGYEAVIIGHDAFLNYLFNGLYSYGLG